jgi:hypothetical protein
VNDIMASEWWRRLNAIFAAVVETPPDQRERVISEECHGDLALETELRKLVAEHEASNGILDRPPHSDTWIMHRVRPRAAFDAVRLISYFALFY